MSKDSVEVLLVEDEAAHAELIVRAFASKTDTVSLTVVSSIKEALSVIKSLSPDLVISDLFLPDGRGTELLPKNQAHPLYPIIIMTSHGDEMIAVDAMKAGAFDYLVKSTETLLDMPKMVELALHEWKSQSFHQYAEQRIQSLLDGIQDGVITIDVDANVRFFSRASEELFGYSENEMMGRPLSSLVATEDQDKFEKQLNAYKADDVNNADDSGFEIVGRKKDGSSFPMHLTLGVSINQGQYLLTSIVRDISGRKRNEEHLYYMANYDQLTKLPNRAMFQSVLDMAIIRAKRYKRKVMVLFLDLDGFKPINDTHGHLIGDRLLQKVAQLLKQCIRDEDMVSRFGGDEFTVLLSDVTSDEEPHKVANKILKALSTDYLLDNIQVNVTVSIGVSIYPDDSPDIPTLFKHADIAMYHAKKLGRNQAQFFTDELSDMVTKRVSLEGGLSEALKKDEFVLHYQPQLDLVSGEIVAIETLVRWHRGTSGLVLPGDFIAVAENSGLIMSIGEWVLRAACEQNKRWQDEGKKAVVITVNLSAKQFYSDELPALVSNILAQSGLAAEFLEFELTESILMDDVAKAIAIVHQLKDIGVSIAVDDFGTGYSSLTSIKRFPVDKLKIDKSFISGFSSDASNTAIVKSIIVLGTGLGLKVVAEGVETALEFDCLKTLGCDEIQGYYYQRPMAAEDMALQL